MGKLFGTDGVRGVANSELTCDLAYKIGQAGAFVLSKNINEDGSGCKSKDIIIGMDTRISGDMLEAALTAGICSAGFNAVSVGVLPTPAIAYLTKKYNAAAGVVISASHNPAQFNGIKWFNSEGYKLSDETEDEIEAIIDGKEGLILAAGDETGRRLFAENAAQDYVDYAVSTVDISLSGMKIAMDCANGAAYEVAPKAIKALGAEVFVIHNQPDGKNINKNCGSTHMGDLQEFTKQNKCDIGLAFDGDADRMLAVDKNGEIVNGDEIMMIVAKSMKEEGNLKKNMLVVTVMSNLGLFLAAEREGVSLEKTKVGDRYVLEEMMKNGYCIGGEQSGHVIFLDMATTGDGLMSALQLLRIIKKSETSLDELKKVMTMMPQVLLNAKVSNDKKEAYLIDEEIVSAIKTAEEMFAGKGRVLIRPSGTEPLVRVMIEGENEAVIGEQAKIIADLIEARSK